MAFQSLGTSTRFNAAAGGLTDFVVASAASGYLTPEQSNVVDGKVYEYYVQNADGSAWEAGSGIYTISSHTLARTAIRGNHLGAQTKVDFGLVAPVVDVFPSPSPLEETPSFPSGTLMLFQQTAAPVGWTKQTTHNDKALRVVSGAASSGGSNSFSTVMAQTVVGNHTLTTSEIPSHVHPISQPPGLRAFAPPTCSCGVSSTLDGSQPPAATNTGNNAGGGGAHNHPINMSIMYVDLIIALKN